MVGRIFNATKQKQGPDISSGLDLDSDICNPRYNLRLEMRDPCFTQSSLVLLKIYTIEKESKALKVVGYAALNLFCKRGTEEAVAADDNSAVSLNVGAHQLRLYARGPVRDLPLTMENIRQVCWRGMCAVAAAPPRCLVPALIVPPPPPRLFLPRRRSAASSPLCRARRCLYALCRRQRTPTGFP